MGSKNFEVVFKLTQLTKCSWKESTHGSSCTSLCKEDIRMPENWLRKQLSLNSFTFPT